MEEAPGDAKSAFDLEQIDANIWKYLPKVRNQVSNGIYLAVRGFEFAF